MITNKSKGIVLLFFLVMLCSSVLAQNKPEFYLRGALEMFRKGNKTNAQRIEILKALIPQDVREQVIISLAANWGWYYTQKPYDFSSYNGDGYLDLCKRVDSTGIKYVVSIGEVLNYINYPDPPAPLVPGDRNSWHLKPNQIDSLFKYTKNCTGIESGENFWTYNTTTAKEVIALLRVCKKYNKKYILGEGGWGYNSFMRFFYDYYTELHDEGLGKYLQATFKNTKPYGALVSQGALLGSWVTGIVGDFGTWNDEWAWTYSSFQNANEFPAYNKKDNNHKKLPFTYYLKSWLLTIAMGGKINFMESSAFSKLGVPDHSYTHYLYPFIRGLTAHDMLPGKAAVLSKVKAIANPYGGTYRLSDGTSAAYTGSNLMTYNYNIVNYKPAGGTNAEPFARLYKMTTGIWADTSYTNTGVTDKYYGAAFSATGVKLLPNSLIREQFPNNPRYLIIPILPHPRLAEEVPRGVETVALSSYQTDVSLKKKFESLYPPVAAGNDAWAVEVDNRFFVINSNENADIDQNFVFKLAKAGIRSLSGTMPFQNILFGKREAAGNYWFQSSGYAANDGKTTGQKYICVEKKTILHFRADRMPTIRVEDGKDGSVTQTWNSITKVLTLTINHEAGAVNFCVVFK
ncbi:glycoside hydrolase family 98 domain-containing protein [Flavobacterium sp. FlaQc-48]|uniref:glycoside hydrolase family 98 domain-containing protein n=1 Tax=Flavobacterium sp. FlaQc-48 TaxID=3374181 RepID=UPI00375842AB